MITTKNNIFCNLINPPIFTPVQIEKCRGNKAKNMPQCQHCSKKGLWCCHFGIRIQEKGKIILSNKKIQHPKIRTNRIRPIDNESLIKEYKIIVEKRKHYPAVINGQFKIISVNAYIDHRKKCFDCNVSNCSIWRGCCGWENLIFNINCPYGKF